MPNKLKRPRVLLVDDEPDLLDLLEMDLARMGLDGVRAATVAEARRHLDAGAFDLCLTDMRSRWCAISPSTRRARRWR